MVCITKKAYRTRLNGSSVVLWGIVGCFIMSLTVDPVPALALGNGTSIYTRQSIEGDPEPSVDQRLGTGFLYSATQRLRATIPNGKLKCVIDTYLNVLQVETYDSARGVGSDNRGLIQHFSQFVERDPHLASIAQRFYLDIGEATQSLRASTARRLSEYAGDINNTSLRPGWLWEKALQYADGNPRLAITLIGLCGHDDIPSVYRYKKIDPELERQSVTLQKRYDDLRSRIEFLLGKMTAGSLSAVEENALSAELKLLQTEMSNVGNEMYGVSILSYGALGCLDKGSAMFLPRSLGESIDLPGEFKEKVARIQKPEGSLQDLPAKAYHYYGAAYIGCQLAKCGVTPDEAAFVQSTFGQTYRSVRLCGQVQGLSRAAGYLVEQTDMSPDDPRFQGVATEFLQKYFSRAEGKSDLGIADYPCDDSWESPLCMRTKSLSLQRIKSYLTEIDAARLYHDWYLGGGSVFGQKIPCSAVRLGGPQDLTESDYFVNRPSHLPRPPGSMCNIPGWSSERCALARAKLATWDVDFEWTGRQHRIGARFGATVCR